MSRLKLPKSRARRVSLLLLAAFFVFAGINHFGKPDFYVAIMPPYLPAHLELVYVSGGFEILGGLGVLLTATRSLAGWGLIALLLAVYPANIHMVLNPDAFVDGGTPLWALYLRLPLQFVMIAWAWWSTREEPEAN